MFNNHRLMAPLRYVPPAEFEANYYRNQMCPVNRGIPDCVARLPPCAP